MPVIVGGGVLVGWAVSVAATDVAISSTGVASTGLAHELRVNPKIIDTMLKLKRCFNLKFSIDFFPKAKVINISLYDPLQYSMKTGWVWRRKISREFN
jgi:hypothetical protein